MHGFHIIDLKRNRPLAALYAAAGLRFFALSLINIFLPLYLLSAGYAVENILVFYLVAFAAAGIGSVLAAYSLVHIGMRYSVGISSLFLAMFYILMVYSDVHAVPVYALAVLAGLAESFYMLPINTQFSLAADGRHEGEEVGMLYEIPFLASILGPVIGGAVIVMSGFSALFMLAIFFVFASVLPLFRARELPRKMKLSVPEKINIYDGLGVFSAGAREVGVLVLWPLFLFFILREALAVGIVESVSLIAAALVSLLIGRLSDKYGERKLLGWGSFANALSWLARTMFGLLDQLILVAVYIGVSALSLLVPMQSMIYKSARKNPVGYFMFEQSARAFGRAFMILAVLLLAADIYLGLLLCAAAAIGCAAYGMKR